MLIAARTVLQLSIDAHRWAAFEACLRSTLPSSFRINSSSGFGGQLGAAGRIRRALTTRFGDAGAFCPDGRASLRQRAGEAPKVVPVVSSQSTHTRTRGPMRSLLLELSDTNFP